MTPPRTQPPQVGLAPGRAPDGSTAELRRRSWSPWVAISLVILAFLGAGSFDDLGSDELRVAGIAAAMAAGGSSVSVPRLAGRPFLEKPPLGFASVAASLRLFGTRSVAARLPGLLFGLLAAGCLGLLALDVYGSRVAGVAGALGLLVTGEHFLISRLCVVDNALAVGTTASVWFLWRAMQRPEQRQVWFPLAAGAVSWACLAKGAIGVVFPGAAFLGLLLGHRSLASLKSGWVWLCPVLVALPLGLWLWAVYGEVGADGLRVVVVDNHLRRFSPSEGYVGGHEEPFHYYLGRLPGVLLPTLLLLPASLRWHWERRDRPAIRRVLGLCAGWLGLGFLVLSAAGTKRVLYLLPILPPVPLLAAGWLASVLEGRPLAALERWTLRGVLGGTILTALALPVALAVLGGGPSLVTLAGTALCLGAAGVSALAYSQERRAIFLLSVLVTAGAAATVALPVAVEVQQREDDPLPRGFYEALDAAVPAGQAIWVLPSSERALGAVTYYIGRTPTQLLGADDVSLREHLDACAAGLRGSEPCYVIVLDKAPKRGVATPIWQQVSGPSTRVLLQETRGRYTTTLLASSATVDGE